MSLRSRSAVPPPADVSPHTVHAFRVVLLALGVVLALALIF